MQLVHVFTPNSVGTNHSNGTSPLTAAWASTPSEVIVLDVPCRGVTTVTLGWTASAKDVNLGVRLKWRLGAKTWKRSFPFYSVGGVLATNSAPPQGVAHQRNHLTVALPWFATDGLRSAGNYEVAYEFAAFSKKITGKRSIWLHESCMVNMLFPDT